MSFVAVVSVCPRGSPAAWASSLSLTPSMTVGWSAVEDMTPVVVVVDGWFDEVVAAPSFFSSTSLVSLLNHISSLPHSREGFVVFSLFWDRGFP